MIKELQILVEVEKSLKLLDSMNLHKSSELRNHLENIRTLQLQSFVENETYNFVLTDALETRDRERQAASNNKTYVSRN